MKKLENLMVVLSRPKWFTILIAIGLISLNIWLLSKIAFVFEPVGIVLKTILVPVVIAGIFYYLFHPLIDWAERKKVKRGVSILLLYVAIIWILAMTLSFVIPTITKQIGELIQLIPTWWGQFTVFLDTWNGPSWTDTVVSQTQIFIEELPSYVAGFSTEILTGVGSQIFPIVGTVTGFVTVAIVTPFVLFYLLKDGKKLPAFILKFFPVRTRTSTQTIMTEMNQQISSYIRGQIIVSMCIGALLFIGFLIIDLPYALTLAIVAGLTSVIPYVGPTIAITPAILLALFTSPALLIKLAIVWTVVQLLEGKLITPNILGNSLKVHPLTILFTILCAGKVFGVIGLVLAIPGYAVIKVIVTHAFNWLKSVTNLYREEDSSLTDRSSGETGA